MLSKTHKLVEQLVAATAPIFKTHPDYDTIFQASCLWFARIMQATPEKGKEFELLDEAHNHISHALQQFLQLEEQVSIAKAAARDRALAGIEGFSSLAPVNGSEPGPALVGELLKEDEGFHDFPDSFETPSPEDENDVASGIKDAQWDFAHPENEEPQDGYNPDSPPRAYT